MTEKRREDGGPAFPGRQDEDQAWVPKPNVGDEFQPLSWIGMSLRDWFAGQALSGVIGVARNAQEIDRIVLASFGLADAMIKESESGKETK